MVVQLKRLAEFEKRETESKAREDEQSKQLDSYKRTVDAAGLDHPCEGDEGGENGGPEANERLTKHPKLM